MPVPSPDPDTTAHSSTQSVLRRAQMPQPEYHALAARLAARRSAGHSTGARGVPALARDNPETISSIVGFGAPVKTGPAIVLMLVALADAG